MGAYWTGNVGPAWVAESESLTHAEHLLRLLFRRGCHSETQRHRERLNVVFRGAEDDAILIPLPRFF